LKAGRRRLIGIPSRKFSERLLRQSKRLSGKAAEQNPQKPEAKNIKVRGAVFDIWQSRFLPEVSSSGFCGGAVSGGSCIACFDSLAQS